MRLFKFLFILTLVLDSQISMASPSTDIAPGKFNYSDTTPLPELSGQHPESHLLAFWKIISGNPTDSNNAVLLSGAGIHWVRHHEIDQSLDFGITLLERAFLVAEFSKRYHLCGKDCGNSYWKWGIDNYMLSSDFLATLVNINHMKMIVNYGYEDLFENNKWIHAEIGAGYGLQGAVISASLGLAF